MNIPFVFNKFYYIDFFSLCLSLCLSFSNCFKKKTRMMRLVVLIHFLKFKCDLIPNIYINYKKTVYHLTKMPLLWSNQMWTIHSGIPSVATIITQPMPTLYVKQLMRLPKTPSKKKDPQILTNRVFYFFIF